MLKSWGLGIALGFLLGLITPIAKADYIYEANQNLFDLTGENGTTNFNVADDSISAMFNIGFDFNFYGNDYTQARMATNGCLHFLSSGTACNDYTPDPLPHAQYTLYPFYTDLIRDGGSKMLAKSFSDKTVFGWYDMKEYGRSNTDNSFEVILWPNDTYEFRYGALNITNHDVLIGEQGSTAEVYTYVYFDECSTGTTNSSSCVNYNWNSSSNSVNTLLESGGSLYGNGSDNSACADNPLSDTSCAGYAAAYLTQQCNITQLYSTQCPSYWEAYDDQQCEEDPQYDPTCAGYTFEASVAYYEDDTNNYGYEEDYWEDDYSTDNCIDNPSYCYDDPNYDDVYGIGMEEYTDEQWYEYDLETFGQTQTDEWYGSDISFDSSGFVVFEDYDFIDDYDVYEEDYYVEDIFIEEVFAYDDPFLVAYEEFEPNGLTFDPSEELLEEFIFHETVLVEDYEDLETYIEFETVEELEEWYEEEMADMEEETLEEEFEEEFMEEEMFAEEDFVEPEEEFEEEVFEEEAVEEIFEDIEEEMLAEAEEEIVESEETDELVAEEREERSGITSDQLSVVASTIATATNSVSNPTANIVNTRGYGSSSSSSGGSGNYGGNTAVGTTSGNTTTSAVASSSSGGGFSTSSSPSISDQIQTAQVQTNTVLSLNQDMSSTSGMGGSTQTVSNVTTVITPLPTFDTNPQVVMADVQVTDMQGQIDTAVSGVMTASEADQIADQIIADNIKEQQEAGQATQEETGQYADQSTLVAFMGYVVGFDSYREAIIPKQETWYEPKSIYTDIGISDNISGYYEMARTNITTMTNLQGLQPNL